MKKLTEGYLRHRYYAEFLSPTTHAPVCLAMNLIDIKFHLFDVHREVLMGIVKPVVSIFPHISDGRSMTNIHCMDTKL